MLTQSLADRFRAVHSQTDIFVIIDLYISDSAPFQLADHLLREKIRHLFLPEIGKNTVFVPNENAVARVHPILSPRNRRALCHVFELVPHAGFHAVFSCQSDEFFKAAGEAFPVRNPISEIVAPLFGVGIPPVVYDEILDTAFPTKGDLFRYAFERRTAVRTEILVINEGQLLLRRRQTKAGFLIFGEDLAGVEKPSAHRREKGAVRRKTFSG